MLFWLVEAVQPQNVVSLHLGGGAHHFAVCQAVERLRLDANCYAVDAELSEEVFQRNENYVAFSQCIEQSAVDAVKQFAEGSVDLLLLDGSSPAIEDEVEAWAPLMSPQSVMVILGTARRGDGNHGRRVFDGLTKKYPSLSFTHGGGVGLVAVGSSPRLLIARLLELADGAGGIQVAREVFARLGRACHDAWVVADREARLVEVEKALKVQEQEVQVLSERYQSASSELTRQEAKSAEYARRIEQQVERNAQERGGMAQRVSSLQEERDTLRLEVDRLQHRLADSSRLLDQKAEQLIAKQLEQSQQALEFEKLRIQDEFREEQLTAAKEQLLEIKESLLGEQKRADGALQQAQVERAEREKLQSELTQEVTRLNQSLVAEAKRSHETKSHLSEAEERLQDKDTENQRLQGELASSQALTKELTSRIENQSKESAEQWDALRQAHEAQLAEHDAAIEQVKIDAEDIKTDLEQQVLQLKSRLHDAEERAARRDSEAESLAKSLSETKSSLQALESQLQQQKQLTSNLQSVESQLRRQLSEKYTEIAALTQMLENATSPEGTQIDQNARKPVDQPVSTSGGGWFSGNKRKREERRLVELIENSREFDAKWYLEKYPDVAKHPEFSKAPARHYLKFGGFEGRDPGPGFDSAHYLDTHSELKASRTNPLVHFLSTR
ncbi:class I SAM-dependent methyltransferase [Orrella marina]|nr:class I SAM-dependent methyltransferase [Orrella marina]